MLSAYFDHKDHANVHQFSESANVETCITFDDVLIKEKLAKVKFNVVHSQVYDSPGIYVVSVRSYSPDWSGKAKDGHPRHILYELPIKVIEAARNNKMIIVIDNQSEGFPLIYKGCDGFLEMHTAMSNLYLPPMSVILVDGNLRFKDQYDEWLISNGKKRMFEHCYALTHLFYFKDTIPSYPLLQDAISNPNVKDFNSLNRTARIHRIEHLIEIFDREINKNALISGYYKNSEKTKKIPRSVYKRDAYPLFCKKVNRYLEKPLVIDGDWSDEMGPTPDDTTETIFNHKIYTNSLLSAVTETAVELQGMFITEKTLKPIVAGHPFMVLGQHEILKTLEEMGYRVDFPGIDQSYDRIRNPIERFKKFHDSLEKWCKYTKEEKIKYATEAIPIVTYNKNVFNSKNYETDFYKRLYVTAAKCFFKKL